MTRKPPSDGNYEVGYGRPPKSTRFSKGTSGNPKRRATDSENISTIYERDGAEKITITENGVPKTITKLEGVAESTFQKALKCDVAATRTVLAELLKLGGPTSSRQLYTLTEADLAVLHKRADFLEMIEVARKAAENDQEN